MRPIARLVALIRCWRRRSRQRAELVCLAATGFDFKDIGLDIGAVAVETTRWPWQRIRLDRGSGPPPRLRTRELDNSGGPDLQQAAAHGRREQHHKAAQLR